MLQGKRILLIVGGGIAAFKSLELIRLIRKAGGTVTPVLTRAAQEFVTPLSASALAADKVYVFTYMYSPAPIAGATGSIGAPIAIH